MNVIIEFIKQQTGTTSDGIAMAMFVVAMLIAIFGLIGVTISVP